MIEPSPTTIRLRRSLTLTQLVLYGLGTTIGAGIYALIGEIAQVAGNLAPWSFLLAAVLAGFTALSFAQLSARFPRAAGTALYVEQGLGSQRLGLAVGLLVILAGTVSSAALLNGFVGYLQQFVAVDRVVVISCGALLLGAIAFWGIAQSVWVAGLISIVEVLGLIWITGLAAADIDWTTVTAGPFLPEFSGTSIAGIAAGAVLSFYAYIGFEDMVEVAEEVKDAPRVLPRAILLTLVLSTAVYLALITTALLALGAPALAGSQAPLADAYRQLTGGEPVAISFIGMFAIINGALIQIIMSARVLYGLASRSQLPQLFAQVHSTRRTPSTATAFATVLVLICALSGTLAILAELTAVTMLSIFTLVNLALFRLLDRSTPWRRGIALAGAAVCAGFALRSLALWLASAP